MVTVISIILVIGAIIFFHELGHLLLAKRAGILCREFAIGFGPKIFSFRKGETLYTFRLLPLGGFVRMAGEDPEVVEIKPGHDVALVLNDKGEVEKIILNNKKEYPEATFLNVNKIDLEDQLFVEGYDVEEELVKFSVHPQAMILHNRQETQIAPRNRQFGSKTIGQRALAIFAGPLANFILAFAILFGYAAYAGVQTNQIDRVMENSPADEAGLQTGDRIVSVNNQAVSSWRELTRLISQSPGQEMKLIIERGQQQLQLSVIPETISNEDGTITQGRIGVTSMLERSFIGAISYGATTTLDFAQLIFKSLGMLVTGGVKLDDLAGPVGIINITGDMAQRGLPSLLSWTAILSVNVGILNLLPLPALDGGRLMFLGIEAVRGRPIDPHKEGMVHFIGFALLMLLILVVTWNDIQRLFIN